MAQVMSWLANFSIGLVVLALSVYTAINPRKIATFFEQVDAIGSKRRSSSVQPTDWNVTVIRVASSIMAVASGMFVALMLWSIRSG
ncbi:hypothetical protein BRD15_01655 [Halobacteriales archaeon SW_6_65_15]|nr:MAG: hypothetical protein BRD15_01655 [Halobacteriales archaeon SW_6_65_15]